MKIFRVFFSPKAYELQMYGPRYVWIVPGDYQDKWWLMSSPKDPDDPFECTPEHLEETLEGHFGTDVLGLSTDNERTVANLVRVRKCLTFL